MCGICGIYSRDYDSHKISYKIKKMRDTLLHRGPDSSGIFIDNNIALGHTRLSILDLSKLGSQPMIDNEQENSLVFNGEIYNYKKLKNELTLKGTKFKTNSDTEVILKAYLQWGLEGLKRLEGIFSIALWDKNLDRLVLMRDRLGVKPLYYIQDQNKLAFASEIKSLLASGYVNNKIDNQSLSEYIWYGTIYEDRTIYKNVKQLKPGNWIIYEKQNFHIEPWWKLEEWSEQQTFKGSKKEALEILESKVDKAIGKQLEADVPVSLFLSGGIDSSLIANSCQKHRKKNLVAYTASFKNESNFEDVIRAKEIANHLNLEHKILNIEENNLEDTLIKLVHSHDEPFADAANIPLYLMSMAFKQHGKVVLQGDGGDELFAGYRQYSTLYYSDILKLIPSFLIKSPMLKSNQFASRLERIIDISKENNLTNKIARLMTMEVIKDPPTDLLSNEKRSELIEETDPFLAYKNIEERFKEKNALERIRLTDLLIQFPSQFLAKVDRSTMSAGIEARVPLIDESVAKFALTIPIEWNINAIKRKILLRKIIDKKLPRSIHDAPKSGFGVPYAKWLKTSLLNFAKEVILDKDFLINIGYNKIKLEQKLNNINNLSNREIFNLWKVFQISLWYSLKLKN